MSPLQKDYHSASGIAGRRPVKRRHALMAEAYLLEADSRSTDRRPLPFRRFKYSPGCENLKLERSRIGKKQEASFLGAIR